jgi:uncharacterized cupin superfamily protein
MGERHPNVKNVDELEWEAGPAHGSRFGSLRKPLAAKSGGKSLGCTLYEVPPGKRAFPLHAHLANEECIFILEGEGIMRMGEREVAVRAGDYVALLPGKDNSHQLVNTSQAPIRYLCLSTMRSPEIAFYPDSSKVGVTAVADKERMRILFKRSAALGGTMADYFDGEDPDGA